MSIEVILKIFYDKYEYILARIKDIGYFLFSPKKYLSIVSDEDGSNLFQRILIYGILSNIIFVFLLLPGVGGEVDTSMIIYGLIPILLIDLLFIIIHASIIIYPLSKLCNGKIRLKEVLTLAITYYFMFKNVPIFLHLTYLISEDYSVAILRGISLYVFFGGILLYVIYTISNSIKQKVIGVLIGFGYSALFIFGLYNVDEWGPSAGFVFIDPIENEVEHVTYSIVTYERHNPMEFNKRFLDKRYRISTDAIRPLKIRPQEWSEERQIYINEFEQMRNKYNDILKSCKYRTSTNMVRIKSIEILEMENMLNALEQLIFIIKRTIEENDEESYEEEFNKYHEVYFAHAMKVIELHNEFNEQVDESRRVRNKYRKFAVFMPIE